MLGRNHSIHLLLLDQITKEIQLYGSSLIIHVAISYTCICLQAIDLIHMDPSLSPFFPSDGYINLTFGLPNFPTEFVDPSIIQDTKVLIEMPFNTKNVRTSFMLHILPCTVYIQLLKCFMLYT